MTENISPDAAARREAARDRGRFGPQDHTAPEVTIYRARDMDQVTWDALARKSEHLAELYAPGQKVTAAELTPGLEVLTETNTTESPFSYAINTSREVRRRWREAGMPWKLTITGHRRAPEDGDTDDEVTFDLAGEPLVLTFHRDRPFTIAH